MELAGDNKWRVRLAIVSHIPLLADQLGKEVFEEKLSELALELLTDKVYAIREAACENIRRLVRIFEIDWVKRKLLPKLNSLVRDENYLRRLNVLPGITGLLQISDRNTDDFETWFKYDLEYIENWNLLLDIKIILKTPFIIFRSKISGK